MHSGCIPRLLCRDAWLACQLDASMEVRSCGEELDRFRLADLLRCLREVLLVNPIDHRIIGIAVSRFAII